MIQDSQSGRMCLFLLKISLSASILSIFLVSVYRTDIFKDPSLSYTMQLCVFYGLQVLYNKELDAT